MSTFPALTAELLRRGYTEDEVKKVLGLNLLRVMRAVEATAARLAGLGEVDRRPERPHRLRDRAPPC